MFTNAYTAKYTHIGGPFYYDPNYFSDQTNYSILFTNNDAEAQGLSTELLGKLYFYPETLPWTAHYVVMAVTVCTNACLGVRYSEYSYGFNSILFRGSMNKFSSGALGAVVGVVATYFNNRFFSSVGMVTGAYFSNPFLSGFMGAIYGFSGVMFISILGLMGVVNTADQHTPLNRAFTAKYFRDDVHKEYDKRIQKLNNFFVSKKTPEFMKEVVSEMARYQIDDVGVTDYEDIEAYKVVKFLRDTTGCFSNWLTSPLGDFFQKLEDGPNSPRGTVGALSIQVTDLPEST